ncbi:carbohydrate binding family 9 domain-containing protein [Aliikangiella sp. G2MR2-5]|uniref:carbohydrate binding family 9 domain-containing protein n=1 Tax=Aliikangiella sp. G2MR2-5 TaxID=2788943 RepID=UPI0018ABB89B|nr:carbohydrate binding family 9 domain-containing protein [Aliikangiella sp. G2MR2-5]
MNCRLHSDNPLFLANLQFFVFIFLLFCFQSTIQARDGRVVKEEKLLGDIPFLKGQNSLDGKLSEVVWKNALEIPLLIETEPAENQVASEKTIARIYQDGEYLYIGVIAFDPNKDQIRAFHTDRDKIWASDYISVKLDTFDNSRQAYQFFVTPTGIQADQILDDNIAEEDLTWDGIWYSSGEVNDTGYTVEFKIPFNTLRFNNGGDVKQWGIEVIRYRPRELDHRYSTQPRERNQSCMVCELNKVRGLSQIKPPLNATLIPSLIVNSQKERDIDGAEAWSNSESETRSSFDLRWGINEQNFLNATINPDFSQVEADAFQLDVNTLTVLYLAEKRPFFQDGADYFNHWGNLIYTRIFEEPDYGIKFTGKDNHHSYGVMLLKDKVTNFLVSHSQGAYLESRAVESNNFVGRYRVDLGKRNHLGLTLTNRDGDGYKNIVYGLDSKTWVNDTDYFKIQSYWSESTYPDDVLADFSGIEDAGKALVRPNMNDNSFSLNYTHSSRDWRWYSTYHQFGEDFRADAGFISRSNWQRIAGGVYRYWYSDDKNKWWQNASVFIGHADTAEMNGDALEKQSNINFEVNATLSSSFGLDSVNKEEHYDGQVFSKDENILWFELTPLSMLEITGEVSRSDAIYYTEARAGETFTTQLGFNFQATEKLNIELEMISQTFDLPEGELYQLDLLNSSLTYQFNERNQLRVSAQYRELELSSVEKYIGSQVLYSYKVNPFTLIYIGYSDKANTTRYSMSPLIFEKTAFAKFSYAWQL